jgi:hypothetical protein
MFFYSWILFIYLFILYRCSWILDYKGKGKEGNEGY